MDPITEKPAFECIISLHAKQGDMRNHAYLEGVFLKAAVEAELLRSGLESSEVIYTLDDATCAHEAKHCDIIITFSANAEDEPMLQLAYQLQLIVAQAHQKHVDYLTNPLLNIKRIASDADDELDSMAVLLAKLSTR